MRNGIFESPSKLGSERNAFPAERAFFLWPRIKRKVDDRIEFRDAERCRSDAAAIEKGTHADDRRIKRAHRFDHADDR